MTAAINHGRGKTGTVMNLSFVVIVFPFYEKNKKVTTMFEFVVVFSFQFLLEKRARTIFVSVIVFIVTYYEEDRCS